MISFNCSTKGHLRKSNYVFNIWGKYSLLCRFHENKAIYLKIFFPFAASALFSQELCSNAGINEQQSP